MSDVLVRQATLDDHDAIAAFTRDSWPEREVGGWIAEVFPDWVEGDGPDQRTVVAEVGGDPAGVCQGLLLSDHEAWLQGMRVHPDHRGEGIAREMTEDLLSWCRDRGAVVARNMVFSWNGAGLGQSRATGFRSGTEFRLVHPEPDPDAGDAATGDGPRVGDDPAAAWSYWTDSDGRDRLRGLSLDDEESWAARELTREWLGRAADDGGLFVAHRAEGVAGMALHTRTGAYEAENVGEGGAETVRVVEYGAATWDDLGAARALFDAIRADAADRGADRTRVAIPETAGDVSDAAACRVEIGDEPHFVLAADLAGRE